MTEPDEDKVCPMCGGVGVIGDGYTERPCPECEGQD